MKALLVVAHGSRRQSSNDEVRMLAERMVQAPDNRFDQVRCAFLELAEPSIPEGIRQCAAAGAEEIVVVPYFLSAGRHVVEDIPAEVAKGKALAPSVNIRVSAYLGAAETVPAQLIKLANEA